MKKMMKFSLVALATVLMIGVVSCSKDTDPADVDLFVGPTKEAFLTLKALKKAKPMQTEV